jgi:hypothetical protein
MLCFRLQRRSGGQSSKVGLLTVASNWMTDRLQNACRVIWCIQDNALIKSRFRAIYRITPRKRCSRQMEDVPGLHRSNLAEV